jgi:transcriptional regulator NrdR family protein
VLRAVFIRFASVIRLFKASNVLSRELADLTSSYA